MAVLRSNLRLSGIAFLFILLSLPAFAANHPPVLSSIGSREVVFGNTLTFLVTAIDPDGNNVTFSCGNLPRGASLNPSTGAFSWTPDINQLGPYSLTITASDDGTPRQSASQNVAVDVVFRTVRAEKSFGFGVSSTVAVIDIRRVSELYPRFTRIEIDGQVFSPDQRTVYTSENPHVKADVASPYNISRGTVSLMVDGKAVDLPAFSNLQSFGEQQNILGLSIDVPLSNLSAGEHVLSFVAGNELGFTTQSITLSVGKLRLTDQPLAYPSPFNPGRGGNLTLQYTLSQDADIDIFIFGSSIQILKKIAIFKGQEGGKAGLNKVAWDGRTDFGGIASNGIYVGTIVDRQNQSVLGKVKLVIY